MKILAAIFAVLCSASVASGQPLSSYPSTAPSVSTDYVPILRPCSPAGVGACPTTGWTNLKASLPDAVTGGGGAPLQSPNLLGDVSIAGKLVVGVPTAKVAMGTDAANANLLIGLPGTATPYMDWRGAGVMSGYSVRFILDALNELHMIGPAGYASLRVTGAISTGNVTSTGNTLRSVAAGITAAGMTQATATPVVSDFNQISVVPSNSGVILPALGVGANITVKNADAFYNVLIYPPVGGRIDAYGVNQGLSLPADGILSFIKMTSVQWYSK